MQTYGIVALDGMIGGNFTVGGGALVGVGGSYASQQVAASHLGLGSYYIGGGGQVFIGIPQFRSQVANFQASDWLSLSPSPILLLLLHYVDKRFLSLFLSFSLPLCVCTYAGAGLLAFNGGGAFTTIGFPNYSVRFLESNINAGNDFFLGGRIG